MKNIELLNKSEELKNSCSHDELAYLKVSRDHINSSTKLCDRVNAAIECLQTHPYFEESQFYIFKKDQTPGKIRCLGSSFDIMKERMGYSVDESYLDEVKGQIDIKNIGEFGYLLSLFGKEPSKEIKIKANNYFNIFLENLKVAFKHAEEYENTFDKSIRDSSTNLFNRAYFDNELQKEADRSLTNSLVLVLLDLDNLREINNKYGHPEGDAVIKGIADLLQNTTKEKLNLAARVGGDEFAMLFPESDINLVHEKCKNLTHLLEKHDFGKGDKATLSIGIAAIPDNAFKAADLYALADTALYESKKTKNQITIYNSKMGKKK